MTSVRVLALLILTYPLWLAGIMALFYYIPALNEIMLELFWEVCGEWDLIRLISALLKERIFYEHVDLKELLGVYLQAIMSASLDAIFLGCCIFALKSMDIAFTKVKSKSGKRYFYGTQHSAKLLDVAGVCIGVALRFIFGVGSDFTQSMLEGVFSIGLMIFGIVQIWTAGKRIRGNYKKNSFREERSGYLLKMLLAILADAFCAIAVINMVTCLMEAPRMLHEGAFWPPVVIWMVLSLVLIYLTNLLVKRT